MLKRVVFVFCAFAFILLFALSSAFSKSVEPSSSPEWMSGWGDDVYIFPKISDEDWKNNTMEKNIKALAIPEKKLKSISTDGLVKTVLAHPITNIFFFNSPKQALDSFTQNFNGQQELLKRQDAGKSLVKLYKKMDASKKTPAITEFLLVEYLLAQPSILDTLTVKERETLFQELIKKQEAKLVHNDIYSIMQHQSIAWVATNILAKDNSSFKTMLANDLDLQQFVERGMANDPKHINDVLVSFGFKSIILE